MIDPETAQEYGARESQAVRSVLVELGQILGAWRDKFVIVGGPVPWLLLDGAEPSHIGTIDGCGIALDHCVMLKYEGMMPDRRKNAVYLQVATIPALLVMKGYALAGRDKKKDAYDIYYSIKHYPGGVSSLVAVCRPLMKNLVARAGFIHIADKFHDRDDFGPVTVRLFLTDSKAAGTMDADQIQTDAFEQVASVLRALDVDLGQLL